MASQPNDRPVTPLRQRMLDDMAMRAMGSRTQHDDVRHVCAVAAFLGRSPDTATAEDVQRHRQLVVDGIAEGAMAEWRPA